ncbi:helix-turn-helix domain-containing protein [Azospirillum sp. sgz301742]
MTEKNTRKRGRRGSPESWSVDAHVGQRVRMRRTLLGYSQERLGEAIGLTFQQVQKYERGSNRISAGTLYRLSQVLDVPVSFFFDSYDDPHAKPRSSRSEARPDGEGDGVISRREARMLRLWRAATPAVADEMLALLSALSPNVRDAREGGEEEPVQTDEAAPTETAPMRIVDRGESVATRRNRRRHGAVWDPADIYRNNKTEA